MLTGMGDKPENNGKDAAKKAREARLAAALRANLRRRKMAARERGELPPQPRRGDDDKPGGKRK
jgi:hypothetical protein